ncbi:hypothetical protein RR42_s1955 [Cupriavidus basilensis]|uniref:Uncharacterized protein n=1 Tax=Cupriavidus basilensis TaxID=68895 RepID=A0A0C4YKE7_9BURK|nr:hypothetical protein RR42_s1955 [Cupriavidus basilensis]
MKGVFFPTGGPDRPLRWESNCARKVSAGTCAAGIHALPLRAASVSGRTRAPRGIVQC